MYRYFLGVIVSLAIILTFLTIYSFTISREDTRESYDNTITFIFFLGIVLTLIIIGLGGYYLVKDSNIFKSKTSSDTSSKESDKSGPECQGNPFGGNPFGGKSSSKNSKQKEYFQKKCDNKYSTFPKSTNPNIDDKINEKISKMIKEKMSN